MMKFLFQFLLLILYMLLECMFQTFSIFLSEIPIIYLHLDERKDIVDRNHHWYDLHIQPLPADRIRVHTHESFVHMGQSCGVPDRHGVSHYHGYVPDRIGFRREVIRHGGVY